MRRNGLAGVILAVAAFGVVPAASVDAEAVPLYTSDDLDRMFGPAPAPPSDPVDKTKPEDWRWVEQFIDRQYARVDADRQFELERRGQDIAARQAGDGWDDYGQPVAWRLGNPASTWWNSVWWRYSAATYGSGRIRVAAHRNPYAWATGENARPQGRATMPRGGHGGGNRQHASRHK